MRKRTILEAPTLQRQYGTLQLLCGNSTDFMQTLKADLKILLIKPSQETSHHYHLLRESIFHVVKGRILFHSSSAGFDQIVSGGDTVIVDPGEDHVLKNVGDSEAIVYEIESPPHALSDKVPHAGIRQDISLHKREKGRFWQNNGQLKLKICGLRSFDAALECCRLGVDAIGINAVGQKGIERTLRDGAWISLIPSSVSVFLLVDSVRIGTIYELMVQTNCDTVQIQGHKTIEELEQIARFIRESGRAVVRTIGVPLGTNKLAVSREVDEALNFVDALLFDASSYGGTGERHDWNVSKSVSLQISVPLIVAGGLGPENTAEAAQMLRPYGIDIESGSEKNFVAVDGTRQKAKDFESIRKLVEIVHSHSLS
jgi:phosphoribosylanthranilate isomerase